MRLNRRIWSTTIVEVATAANSLLAFALGGAGLG